MIEILIFGILINNTEMFLKTFFIIKLLAQINIFKYIEWIGIAFNTGPDGRWRNVSRFYVDDNFLSCRSTQNLDKQRLFTTDYR